MTDIAKFHVLQETYDREQGQDIRTLFSLPDNVEMTPVIPESVKRKRSHSDKINTSDVAEQHTGIKRPIITQQTLTGKQKKSRYKP